MKFTEEQMETVHQMFSVGDKENGIEFIEQLPSEEDGKWIHDTKIFSFEGKYYAFYMIRCGSYHTDWHWSYLPTDCPEVERVEVVREEWKIK